MNTLSLSLKDLSWKDKRKCPKYLPNQTEHEIGHVKKISPQTKAIKGRREQRESLTNVVYIQFTAS